MFRYLFVYRIDAINSNKSKLVFQAKQDKFTVAVVFHPDKTVLESRIDSNALFLLAPGLIKSGSSTIKSNPIFIDQPG